MKVNRANTLLLTVISVATLLVAVIGATFAYFTALISNGETGTTITVGAGKLLIEYASGSGNMENIQTADDIKPEENKPAITKDFTITATNSTEAVIPYDLQLIVTDNDFTANALSYTLSSTNTGDNGNVALDIEGTGIPTVSESPLSIPIGGGFFTGIVTDSVHTYELKIFFQETFVDQDIDKSKTFGAYINVVPGHAYTTSTTIVP